MKRIISLMAVVLILVCGGFGAYVWHWEHHAHVLEIYCFALDKSGGSAGNLIVFIRTPDGHTVLIDGGKSASVINALTSVMPFYRRSIDTLISSDLDDSHITGLVNVLDRYNVGQVIDFDSALYASVVASSSYVSFENSISQKKIKEIKVSSGDLVNLGDPTLSMTVLFPSPDFQFSKTNSPSMAFLIQYASTTLLFSGDITKKEQSYMSSTTQSAAASLLSNLSDHPNVLLILPHAENVGEADQGFISALNPRNVVDLKKITPPRVSHKNTNTDTETTPDTSKPKKPAKIPFSITDLPGLSITNLATDGDTEFISNGFSFSDKKLK